MKDPTSDFRERSSKDAKHIGELIPPALDWIGKMRECLSLERVFQLLEQHYQLREEFLESLPLDTLNNNIANRSLYIEDIDAQIVLQRVLGAGNEGIAVEGLLLRSEDRSPINVVIKFSGYDSSDPSSLTIRKKIFREGKAYRVAGDEPIQCMVGCISNNLIRNAQNTDQNINVLVLEKAAGVPLVEAVQHLTEDTLHLVPALFHGTLTAVSELLGRNIYHFDLSPGNIMVDWSPRDTAVVKIIDFASSRVVAEVGRGEKEVQQGFGETWYSLATILRQRFSHKDFSLLAGIGDGLRMGKIDLQQADKLSQLLSSDD